MARNVKHAGKVSGSAQIETGEPFGSTFQKSTTHAPTLKGSSTSPKGKIAVNGVVPHAGTGPVFTCNDPAIDFPSRKASRMDSKVIAESTSRLEASGIKTVGSPENGGGRTGYGLQKSYDKSGRTDKTKHSLV